MKWLFDTDYPIPVVVRVWIAIMFGLWCIGFGQALLKVLT